MRIHQRKSDGASLVTERDEKPCGKAEFTKVTARNLTTLDFIALVVLTMFPHVLLHVVQTDDVNHPEKDVDIN